MKPRLITHLLTVATKTASVASKLQKPYSLPLCMDVTDHKKWDEAKLPSCNDEIRLYPTSSIKPSNP